LASCASKVAKSEFSITTTSRGSRLAQYEVNETMSEKSTKVR